MGSKLKPKSVEAANNRFWEAHPELNGRQIQAGEDAYAAEWKKYYKEESTKNNAGKGNAPVKEPVLPCKNKAKKNDNKTEKEKEVCKFASLKVSKPGRKFDLMINADGTSTGGNCLEIVAGKRRKKASITIETKGLAGPCSKHDHVNNLYYSDWDSYTSKTDSAFKFDAVCPPITPGLLNADFIWPRYVSPLSYNLNADTCGASADVAIKVYPDIKWEVTLGFEFEWATFGGKEKSKEMESGSKLEYSLTAEYDGNKEIDLSSKTEKDDGKDTNVPSINSLRYLRDSLRLKPNGLLKDIWGGRSPGKIEVKSKPEISANWGWQEIEGSPKCGFAYGFKAGFSPLLDIEGSIDFAGPILMALPVVGPFLAGAKKLLELTESGEITAKLTAQGSISIEATGNKYVEKEEAELNVSGSGFVMAQFELVANVKLDIVIFSVGSGVTLGSRAKWKLKDLKLQEESYGASMRGTVDFEGLKVYYSAYVKAGFSETKSSNGKYQKRERLEKEYKTQDDEGNEGDGKLLGYIVDPDPGFIDLNIPIIGSPPSES